MKNKRLSKWNYRKITEAVLVIYLILITFYGKAFIPIHLKFLMKYPLVFPLLLILLFKAFPVLVKGFAGKEPSKAPKRNKVKDNKETASFFMVEKFNAFPKKHYLTALLIFIAVFCVKSYIAKGITTHVFHPDEEIRISDLTRMLSTHSLDYERYNQPPLFYYSNYFIFSIYYNLELRTKYGEVGSVPYHYWFGLGRQINSVYGALFVAAVFILCYQIFGFMYGLLAAFTAFVSPLRLNIDSLFRTQPASDFYTILVFIILVSLLRERKTYKFASLAVLSSITICSFFLKIVIALPVGLFLLFDLFHKRRWTKELTIFTVTFLLLSILLMIPPLTHQERLRQKLSYQVSDLENARISQAEMEEINIYRAVTYWTQKEGIGYGLFILAAFGTLIGLTKHSRWGIYIYSMIAAHYLIIGSFPRSYNRYSSFLIPFYSLFAFLALKKALDFNSMKKWMKEKTAYYLSGLIVLLCLIPFIISFTDIIKDTARPHNLDLFLKWRNHNYQSCTPAISGVNSLKIKDSGVVVIPHRYLYKPNWINLASYISKRYKIILLSDPRIEQFFMDWKTWKRVKTFDNKTGKGGCFYVLENSVPPEKLKNDPQLTDDSIPDRWKY